MGADMLCMRDAWRMQSGEGGRGRRSTEAQEGAQPAVRDGKH